MTDPDLEPDCRNCEALCCILLPFDKGPSFGFDKAAGELCRHLDGGHRCTIHARLAEQGFSGCVRYTCLGAGQRVTQGMIAGERWRDDPVRRQRIETGFRALRLVHEALALLKAAATLGLPPQAEAERQALLARLDAGRDWSDDALVRAIAEDGIVAECRRFLAGLRGLKGIRPPRR